MQVKRLLPGGVCELTAGLSVGDRLLECNGQSLQGLTQTQCLQILKDAGPRVTLTLLHEEDDDEGQGEGEGRGKGEGLESVREEDRRSGDWSDALTDPARRNSQEELCEARAPVQRNSPRGGRDVAVTGQPVTPPSNGPASAVTAHTTSPTAMSTNPFAEPSADGEASSLENHRNHNGDTHGKTDPFRQEKEQDPVRAAAKEAQMVESSQQAEQLTAGEDGDTDGSFTDDAVLDAVRDAQQETMQPLISAAAEAGEEEEGETAQTGYPLSHIPPPMEFSDFGDCVTPESAGHEEDVMGSSSNTAAPGTQANSLRGAQPAKPRDSDERFDQLLVVEGQQCQVPPLLLADITEEEPPQLPDEPPPPVPSLPPPPVPVDGDGGVDWAGLPDSGEGE